MRVDAVVAVVMFLIGFGLLLWNEKTTSSIESLLKELVDKVICLEHASVDVHNNNKLIHVTAPLSTDQELSDVMLDVSVEAAVLQRRVYMYQWVEHEERRTVGEGDEQTEEVSYSYSQEWHSSVIDSSGFGLGYRNPTSFPVEPLTLTARTVYIGPFQLDDQLRDDISDFQKFPLSTAPDGLIANNGFMYSSRNTDDPQIGDVRIELWLAGRSGSEFSVIGWQLGATIEHHVSRNGQSFPLIDPGPVSADKMIRQRRVHNLFYRWLFRAIAWILVVIATFLCQHTCVINWLLAVFPPSVRHWVTSLSPGSTALVCGSGVCLLMLAAIWSVYQPRLTLVMCATGVAALLIGQRLEYR